ncbi:hypothetical protein [Streptomyces sp. NPDC055085]
MWSIVITQFQRQCGSCFERFRLPFQFNIGLHICQLIAVRFNIGFALSFGICFPVKFAVHCGRSNASVSEPEPHTVGGSSCR